MKTFDFQLFLPPNNDTSLDLGSHMLMKTILFNSIVRCTFQMRIHVHVYTSLDLHCYTLTETILFNQWILPNEDTSLDNGFSQLKEDCPFQSLIVHVHASQMRTPF